MLNNLEHEVLDELLDMFINHLYTEGCNDFKITVTNNNRDELIEMLQGTDDGYREDMVEQVQQAKEGEKMDFLDHMLLNAIKDTLAKRMYEND